MNREPCPNCGWVHPTAVEIAATKRQRLVQIIHHVAIAFGLSVDELRGLRRMMHIVEARHLVFAVARYETKLSLEEIGQALNRDHTTVIFGIRATVKRFAEDSQFRAIVTANFPDYAKSLNEKAGAA